MRTIRKSACEISTGSSVINWWFPWVAVTICIVGCRLFAFSITTAFADEYSTVSTSSPEQSRSGVAFVGVVCWHKLTQRINNNLYSNCNIFSTLFDSLLHELTQLISNDFYSKSPHRQIYSIFQHYLQYLTQINTANQQQFSTAKLQHFFQHYLQHLNRLTQLINNNSPHKQSCSVFQHYLHYLQHFSTLLHSNWRQILQQTNYN